MAENSPLDVSTWIRKLGPDFKDSITPYSLSCTFPYHKREGTRKSLRLDTSHKNFLSLILTVTLSQIYSQTNKKVISNIKLEGLEPEKVSIK